MGRGIQVNTTGDALDNAVFWQASGGMGSTIEGYNSGKGVLCPETVCNVAGIPDAGAHGLSAIRSNLDPYCFSLFSTSIDGIQPIGLMSLSRNHDVLI